MSRQTRQFFEQLKSGEPPTLVESIKEAASVLKDIGGQIWDGAKPMFDHGRTELASAIFSSHDAHVVYMRPENGVEQGQDQTNEMAEDQRDLQREM